MAEGARTLAVGPGVKAMRDPRKRPQVDRLCPTFFAIDDGRRTTPAAVMSATPRAPPQRRK